MINKQAITRFLGRKMESWDWLKHESVAELDEAIAALKPVPKLGDLWAHQKVCFLILELLQRFMLHIDMGGGKALPDDEPVLTPTGWKAIAELRVGDLVIGKDGGATRVTGVFPQGVKQTYEAVFSDGTKVRCTDDHLWAINTPTRNWAGKPHRVKALRDFKNSLRDTNGWRQHFIPICEPVQFAPQDRDLVLDPYYLGAWLGDGCRNTTGITSMDSEIINRINKRLPTGLTVKKNRKQTNRAASYNFTRARGTKIKNELASGLKRLNLYTKYSHERFIPKEYLFSDITSRTSLLQGLVDTDGFISKDGKCYFDTASVQLAFDFAHLIRSLGGSATISDHKKNNYKGHYNVYFSLSGFECCSIKRKLNRLLAGSKRAKQATKAFDRVTQGPVLPCTCISVAAADGLFITSNFTVTHNSLISLSALSYAKQRGDKVKAIVFVPYITAIETWIEETAKHTPHLVCVPLAGSTANNMHKLQHAEGDIFVMCYQSAVAMLAEPAKGKTKKRKWTVQAARVRAVFEGFNFLIMDEIHRCKKASSLTYRMCRAISARAEWVIGLTGTPFGRDLADLWPQFYLIDFGDTLGPTLEFYKAVFFKEKINYFGAYEYTFNQKLFPDLQRIIKHSSIRYAIDDLHDMPPKVYRPMKLGAPEGIKAYADKAIENIKAAVNAGLKGKAGYREVESEYLKLRQLSSGFMTLRGEDNDKLQIAFSENPKLDLLEELLEDISPKAKFIVFHHFVYTNKLISERLDKMKIKHARIYGKTKDPIAELRRFKSDPQCRGLVLNSKSGSSSLNLQIANYAIFFEQPDSAIDRQQAERRIWRPGQTKRVNIIDFLMKDTADHKLHAANKAGKNLLQALLDGKTKF